MYDRVQLLEKASRQLELDNERLAFKVKIIFLHFKNNNLISRVMYLNNHKHIHIYIYIKVYLIFEITICEIHTLPFFLFNDKNTAYEVLRQSVKSNPTIKRVEVIILVKIQKFGFLK